MLIRIPVRTVGRAAILQGAVALALAVTARPASAQIFSWRDTNGNLVLSNRQQGQSVSVASYEVPDAQNVRATRYVSADATRQYDSLIAEHAGSQGVRTDLIRAVIQVESGFNPYAKSPKGALGLMQLMPATIRQYGVANPFSPKENIRAGVAYLRDLLDRYSDNEVLALAAYNAGPGAVDRHGQSIPPYRETQNYVSKVSEIAGPRAKVAGTNIYRIVQIVDGQERVLFSTDPEATINRDARPPSDPTARTPAQVLQSSGVFLAP
jgi:soluble lytic murein transglycosylase-like protein